MAPARLLVLPPEYATLGEEEKRLLQEAAGLAARRRILRKHAMEVAGWTRCCRCWPSCVDGDGFCSCCLYNHVTGEQLERPAPFFGGVADPPAEPTP